MSVDGGESGLIITTLFAAARTEDRALEPFQEQHRERITLGGPPNLWLDSAKAVMVAMVIHELATNAVKYGALSNGTGCLSVTWDRL
jgi:two-component sensor histidine kinase